MKSDRTVIILRDQFSVTRLKIGLIPSLVKVYLGKINRLPAKKGTSINGVQATSRILSKVGETQLITPRAIATLKLQRNSMIDQTRKSLNIALKKRAK